MPHVNDFIFFDEEAMANLPSKPKPAAADPKTDTIVSVKTAANLDVTLPPASSKASNDATLPLTPVTDKTAHLSADELAAAATPPGSNTMKDSQQESSDQSMPALAEDAKESGLSTLKDYRLISKLGEGGMGAVYKAQQLSLDRVVAIKVPFKHLAKDASFIGRFYREARIMAKLDHPNILRCYGVGEENGWHYLAMEFIDGASMQSWLKQLGKIPLGDALHVTIACGNALQHAHEQDLIHRDIKPDNILITKKGQVKVADMGLAKALTDDLGLSRTGMGAGTPHYMAPEQARDAKHVDGRSDIYALGCMLYAFITGKTPFSADTYVDLILEKEKGKFTPARRSSSDVPEKLDLMIDKAVSPKPELRYKSCAEFAKDLQSLGLTNETLSFIPGATATNLLHSGVPSTLPSTSATKPAAAAPKTAPAKPGAPAPGKAAGGVWYVALKSSSGKVFKKKMTTQQVTLLIKGKKFDMSGLLSRNLKGPFRNLAYYKEFEHVLAGRVMQAKADKKGAQYHNMYEKILKEEKSYKLKKWLGNLGRNVWGFISLAIFLLVLAGACWFVWPYVASMFKSVSDVAH
jgi:serine/threonine-protein kinase